MKYYLATTGISEIWNLESNLLLLGPWCLTDEKNKSLLEGRDYLLVPSPWKPALKIKEAEEHCHKVYEELLLQLSESLNSIHQVSYPLKYWRILIGPWLLHFIGVLYDRYKRIEKVLELFPDFYTRVLPREQCKVVSFDTYDFMCSKVDEDYYNLQLFSIVAYDLCPHNIIVQDYKSECKIHPKILRYSWKRKLFNKLITSLDSFFKCPIALCDMHHLTPQDMVLLKLKGRFKTFHFMHFESIKKTFLRSDYSHEIRDAIKLRGAGDKFQSLLYKVVPEAIPMSYMENYKFYKSRINNMKNIDSVKVVGSAVGWYTDVGFKFFTAEAVAKGASLIVFQHGGGYGMALSVQQKRISLEKDIFYTWGWVSKKDNKTKPLPSHHLSRLKDTYLPKLDNILFVGTAIPRYHDRFFTALLPEDMPKYFEDKKIFFQTLPDEFSNKILYRPYVHDYGWKELEIVRNVCPNAKFILKGRLLKWMQKVKLVVIDHPATSFIEALTINVPSIFYWDHKFHLMCPEAEEYFRLLRNVGILFKDPLSAAKKVKEIFNDPMSWWLKDAVQKARLEFCRQYAYARKDWARIWVQELKQLLTCKRTGLNI